MWKSERNVTYSSSTPPTYCGVINTLPTYESAAFTSLLYAYQHI